MSNPPDVAVQLFTLRSLLETDPAGAIAAIVDAGFDAVELFRPIELLPSIEAPLRASGLRVPALHASIVGQDPRAVFETAKGLGAHTVIDPRVDPARWTERDEVLRIADELNALAATAAEWGLAVGYHNHDIEVSTQIDGRAALHVFAEALAPEVSLEVDVYWAAIGGAEVPTLLRDLGDRVRLLHVKDAPLDADGSLIRERSKQLPFGAGGLDAAGILAAAPAARTLVVEFDAFEGDVTAGIAAARTRVLDLIAAR